MFLKQQKFTEKGMIVNYLKRSISIDIVVCGLRYNYFDIVCTTLVLNVLSRIIRLKCHMKMFENMHHDRGARPCGNRLDIKQRT